MLEGVLEVLYDLVDCSRSERLAADALHGALAALYKLTGCFRGSISSAL